MHKEIKRLENSLKTMKSCLKIPNVENCICFSDAFKVLNSEVNELNKKIGQISDLRDREKFIAIKKEIEEIIKKSISKGNKECIGCNSCTAAIVFNTYPGSLNNLYLDGEL